MGMVRGTTAPMASRWWGRSRVGEGKHVGAAAAQEAVDVEEEQQGARMRGSRAEEPGHGRLGLASVVRARERRRSGGEESVDKTGAEHRRRAQAPEKAGSGQSSSGGGGGGIAGEVGERENQRELSSGERERRGREKERGMRRWARFGPNFSELGPMNPLSPSAYLGTSKRARVIHV